MQRNGPVSRVLVCEAELGNQKASPEPLKVGTMDYSFTGNMIKRFLAGADDTRVWSKIKATGLVSIDMYYKTRVLPPKPPPWPFETLNITTKRL